VQGRIGESSAFPNYRLENNYRNKNIKQKIYSLNKDLK
jgi:hypothetical protein